MVKVGKLWGDAKFASLSPISKLLYCYLSSQPNISTLGVVVLDSRRITLDLKILEIDKYLNELVGNKFVSALPQRDNTYLIVVLDHFKSLPKSKSNLRKAIEEGREANEDLRSILRNVFSSVDYSDNFKPPTAEEVSEYALSLGYSVNGKDFVEYYSDNDWYDKNNKKVRNWKSKCRNVWCRDKNKIEIVKGAPKGYENFFVEIDGGERIYPTAWIAGMPTHNNYLYAQYLIDEYNARNS